MLVQVSVRTSRTGMQNFVKQFIEKKLVILKRHGTHYGNTGCGIFKWDIQN